jgi:hypothetical protein
MARQLAKKNMKPAARQANRVYFTKLGQVRPCLEGDRPRAGKREASYRGQAIPAAFGYRVVDF